jgi:acyl carrier protein
METPAGTEPCAVLAFRGEGDQAAAAIERANSRLAEFQRLRRWVLWPEPDLPRTSTGKVRRKAVASGWPASRPLPPMPVPDAANNAGAGAFGVSTDWLLAMIAQISGEAPAGVGDELRLTEDLHLDSLGRVQLAAAIEERLGMVSESGLLEEMQTLGELRQLVAGEEFGARAVWFSAPVSGSGTDTRPPSKLALNPLRKLCPHSHRISTLAGRGSCPSAGCVRPLLRRSCALWSGCWRILSWLRPTSSPPMRPC